MGRIRNDQDIQLNITAPSVDGNDVILDQIEWDLDVYGDRASVNIKRREGSVNIGEGSIPATVEIEGSQVRVYAKGSVKPFGAGKLYTTMTLYLPNPHFGGEKVVKTLRSEVVGVQLV